MKFLLFLMLFLPSLAFSQLTVNPAIVNGNIDLDTSSATITFSNTTTTPIPMNLSLVPKTGFSITNRCSGKTLNRNQSCYIILTVNDSLLSAGVNTASINQNGSLYFTVQRTKIQGQGSSVFEQSSIAMNDFLNYTITIRNLTPTVKSYSPAFSGIDASKYNIILNRCQNVASAKTCNVTISLSPQSAGTFSASLTEPQITASMSVSSIITGSTSGSVPTPVEGISLNQSSIDFGTLTRFGVTGYRQIIVTNTGNMGISPIISINGSLAKTALNRCLGIVLPGRSCSLYIYLDIPSTEGNGTKSGLSVSIKPSVSATAQEVSILANLQVSGNSPQLVTTNPMVLVGEVYSVSVGSYHSCALDSNGIARCWGWGAYGKLGSIAFNNTTNAIPLYVRMDQALSGKNVIGIAASGWQTCEMTSDNKVFCQGYNSFGTLGNNTNVQTSNPTEVYMNGSLSGKFIKTMSSGYSSSCAIASDDYVYCWGDGYRGSIGNGFNTTATGTVLQPTKVNGLIQTIKMKQIASNGYMNCSLSLDDRVFCWGGTQSLPLEIVLPNSEKAKFISIGSAINVNHSCAVSQTNKIYCWNENTYSPFQITLGSILSTKTIDKIVTGNTGLACLITSEDYAYCFNATQPSVEPVLISLCQAPYNKQVKSIGLGQVHTCASTTDNQVYCWGQNNFGQLGDGTNTDSASPVLVNFN